MRSYRNFLWNLGDQLMEAIRQAEEEEWHHLDLDDARYLCYNRLVTWMVEVGERAQHYVNVKGQKPRRHEVALPGWSSTSEGMDRHKPELLGGGISPRQLELDNELSGRREEGVDNHQDSVGYLDSGAGDEPVC